MSLSYQLTKIADYEAVCFYTAEHDQPGFYKAGDRLMTAATEAVIFGCMATGVGAIRNEADALEYFGRMTLHEAVNGAMRREQTAPGVWSPRKMTLAEVRAHIGLTTNAGTETRTAWQKRFVENSIRSALYDARRKEQDEAKAEAA